MLTPTFYRSQLSSEVHREAYQQVTAALLNQQSHVFFSRDVTLEIAQKAVQACHLDHPGELFYVNFWRVRYSYFPAVGIVSADFEFLLDSKTIDACAKQICRKIRTVQDMVMGIESPAKRYRRVADFIARDVEYYDSGSALWDHTVIGALNHRAVCEGIAKLFLMYCQHLRLPCAVISGEVDSGQKHAWNMIQIGDEVRYVDITSELKIAKTFKHCSPTLIMTQQQAMARGYRW